MHDPFVGTWELNPAESEFDPNHRPSQATMRFELNADGAYVLKAEGVNQKGERVAERPTTFVPDGRPYAVPDFPGLSATTVLEDPHTIRGEVRREDGTIVGGGTYVVSADGKSLTATTAGFDTQLRRFETKTVWDRR